MKLKYLGFVIIILNSFFYKYFDTFILTYNNAIWLFLAIKMNGTNGVYSPCLICRPTFDVSRGWEYASNLYAGYYIRP